MLKSALKIQEMPFQRPKISKWVFKPIYFVQKCPQNAGNAVSETQISKHFRGACPRTPLKLCRHYGLPLTNILATPLHVMHGWPNTQDSYFSKKGIVENSTVVVYNNYNYLYSNANVGI